MTLAPPPPASSATARKVMLGNRRESATERALRSALHARGHRFRKDYAPVAGLRCRVDVAFTRDKLAIFVDGCFWHRCPQHASDPKANGAWWQAKLDGNVARDRRNDKALGEAGWTVLRLWAHEPTHVMAHRVLEVLEELQAMRPERTGGVAQHPDARSRRRD